MFNKPRAAELGDFFQRSRLFKKVGGSGNDLQSFFAEKPFKGRPVKHDDRLVISTNDQQRRHSHLRNSRPREVRAAAARNDGTGHVGESDRRNQSSGGPGAGAEETQWELARFALLLQPGRRADQPLGEQIQYKRNSAVCKSTCSSSRVSRSINRMAQPHCRRTQATYLISRAKSAAAAPVREQDHSAAAFYALEFAVQHHLARGESERWFVPLPSVRSFFKPRFDKFPAPRGIEPAISQKIDQRAVQSHLPCR